MPESGYEKPFHLKVVTGTAIAPLFKNLAESLHINNLQVTVVPVENNHFGTSVNVSGLLTAKDMIATLEKSEQENPADGILIPESALRTGDNVFLDDMTLDEFLAKMPVKTETARTGEDYFEALTDWNNYFGVSGENANYMWQSNAAYTKPEKR